MCIRAEGMTRDERKNEAITRAKKKLCEWCVKNAHDDLSCVANFKIAPAWPRIEGTKEERERAFLVYLKRIHNSANRGKQINEAMGCDYAVASFSGQLNAYENVLRKFELVLGNES